MVRAEELLGHIREDVHLEHFIFIFIYLCSSGTVMTVLRVLTSSVLMLVLVQSGARCARRFRGGRNPQPRRSPQPPPPTHRAERGEATESFPLDFTAVEENMDNFMTQVKNLAQSLYPCSAQKLDYDMKLNLLDNTSVTCNDGSPAG